MRLVGHVSRVGREEECIQGFGWGNLKTRDHLEDLGIDGRILLTYTLKK
jgi:hypothetical protein